MLQPVPTRPQPNHNCHPNLLPPDSSLSLKPTMRTSPFSLLLLILSSFTALTSTAATARNRRTLHQPFFPSAPPAAPPPSPPPPSPAKYPFSSSTSTPGSPPFFPSGPPSPPNSPPSPGSFASFPANISSLILPHSPSPSKPLSSTLVAVAAALTASAALVTAVSFFLYVRRRRRRPGSPDDKSNLSDISLRVVSHVLPKNSRRSPPPTNNNASSDFLYLGNIATSRGGAIVGDGVASDGDASLRKLDSPELRPLPPLRQQNTSSKQQNFSNAASDVASEEEEFYSPRGSSGGRESSIETGSASVPPFAAAKAVEHNHVLRSVSSDNSSMYSSSESGSPESTSPPASSSPTKLRPKSPDLSPLNDSKSSSPSVSPPSSSSPDRCSEKSLVSSPGITYDVVVLDGARIISPARKVKSNPLSPSLSPLQLSSPESPVEKNHHDSLARMPYVDGLDCEKKNQEIPLLSLSSPERDFERTNDFSTRVFNVSVVDFEDPLRSINPVVFHQLGGTSKKNSRTSSLSSSSPRTSSVLNLNVETPVRSRRTSFDRLSFSKKSSRTPSLSSFSHSSPERAEEYSGRDRSGSLKGLGSRNSRTPAGSSLSSSPERHLEKTPPEVSDFLITKAGSPARLGSAIPPELPRPRRHWEIPFSPDSSPLEKTHDSSSPRMSTDLNQNSEGLAYQKHSRSSSRSSLSSPQWPLEKTHDSSPRISNVVNQNSSDLAYQRHSRSSSRSSLSSPQRPLEKLEKTHDSSPRMSNVSNQNLEELAYQKHSRTSSWSSLSSPQRPLENTQESSTRISNVSNPNVGSPARTGKFTPPPPLPPPPPPLPPLPPSRRHWEVPVSTQSVPPPILRPPVLVAATRPANISNPTSISPVELPPHSENAEEDEETEKPKLKPLHWDKVRASSDREMVWDHLNSSSFRLNEEMIETLFVVNKPSSSHKEATRRYVLPSPSQENRVLDPKKAQNIAIALRALNVTIEEVCEALLEGNVDALGTELLESLLKMAPTKEEEYRLREYKDDSPYKLGPAEKFLKAVLDIPCAFKRADAMLYIANFESEVDYLKKSFETLEVACEELRNSRMFLKLLEAVLKTGNRMNVGTNRGDAHAFKLDTLLKLVDVKGADGKTTLLHFVVQEIIRSEGARLSCGDQNPSSSINDDARCRKLGLQVVSALSSELQNVKKSAAMDSDVLSSDVLKLFKGLGSISETVRLNEEMGLGETTRKFSESMKRFMKMAEEEIIRIQAQESVALSLVKEITEYFHGNSAKEEAHPFRIFTVVRDFLTVLDKVCKEVGMINERTIVSSAHKFPVPVNPMMQPLVHGFQGRRQYGFSDDESSSP